MTSNLLDPKYGGYIPAVQQTLRSADCLSVSSSVVSEHSNVFSDASEASSVSSKDDSENGDLSSPSRSLDCVANTAGFKAPSLSFSGISQSGQESGAFTQLSSQQGHPRRSSRSLQKPPRLARSDERKTEFVNDLVDSATSMVEVIWPRWDAGRCRRSLGQGPLTMRLYIEETLRRSRTSYSTLQVALYYLILFKYNISSAGEASTIKSALHCGRRMFLAALILASKYLQDRNYSTRAWSKMCGLSTGEINDNERCFLRVVDWKLHIPDRIFRRWTDVVLRYATPQSHGSTAFGSQGLWRQVIPYLTPELDDPRLPVSSVEITGHITPESGPSSPNGSFTSERSQPMPTLAPSPAPPTSSASWSGFALPYFGMTPAHSPETPGLRRTGLLPTPSLTPSMGAVNTPAAGSSSFSERQARYRSSAMACLSRCGSLAPSVFSLASSPESMITDASTPSSSSTSSSSRGPSICSVASLGVPCWPLSALPSIGPTMADNGKPLRRSARFHGTALQPITIEEPQIGGVIDLTSASQGNGRSTALQGRKRLRPGSDCEDAHASVELADEDDIIEVVDLSDSRKKHCPSRSAGLGQRGGITPPDSASPESNIHKQRLRPTVTTITGPSTPPESTTTSPELLMRTGPDSWTVLVD